jgi:hypothetical protein
MARPRIYASLAEKRRAGYARMKAGDPIRYAVYLAKARERAKRRPGYDEGAARICRALAQKLNDPEGRRQVEKQFKGPGMFDRPEGHWTAKRVTDQIMGNGK